MTKNEENMAAATTAKIVISRLLKELNLTRPEFASITGMNKRKVDELLSGRTKKITSETASAIKRVYPEISERWLITGDGEMYVNSSVNSVVQPSFTPQLFTALQEQINNLNTRIDKMEQQHKEDMQSITNKFIDFLMQNNKQASDQTDTIDKLTSTIKAMSEKEPAFRPHASRYQTMYSEPKNSEQT